MKNLMVPTDHQIRSALPAIRDSNSPMAHTHGLKNELRDQVRRPAKALGLVSTFPELGTVL
jgi:hypothetical protein